MFWQATMRHGDPISGESAAFSDIRHADVAAFAIAERHQSFCLVKWECTGAPLNYAVRSTPNETVHVIEMPDRKVFVFEGTGDVVTIPQWGTGAFAPIQVPQQEVINVPSDEEDISG